MLCCMVPKGVRKLADRGKGLFSGRLASYCNLCSLYALFLFECDTLSATARVCPWSHSVSDLSRAVRDFKGNRLMRRLRSSVLRRYRDEGLNPDDFCFAIDDTANPKYGKGCFRVGRWRGSKGNYYGQKVLVVSMVDIKRGFAIPLSYAFIPKKESEDYRSGLELSLELLQEIIDSGFPRLHVKIGRAHV